MTITLKPIQLYPCKLENCNLVTMTTVTFSHQDYCNLVTMTTVTMKEVGPPVYIIINLEHLVR